MRVWAFVFTICLSGCASHSADPGEDPVRQYLRLAVALGERDADSLDYYYGPSDWVSGVRANPPPLRQIKQSAASLIERLKTPSMGAVNATQTQFLTKQLRAIAARADLLMGTRRTFDEEAEVFFGIMPQQPFTSERLADVRDKIGRLLPGPAPLATRYAEFDQEFTIPAERLPAVFDRALQACRERTLAHIPLPPGEHVRVEYVSNKPWNAYSHYLGNFQSLIEVNADFAVTVDRVLELACHEGYPGHHVYNSIQDAEHVQRERRLELLAQLTFSPQSIISEAAATIAGDVAFPDAARLAFERDELFPLAGLDNSLAERYLRIQHLVDELE